MAMDIQILFWRGESPGGEYNRPGMSTPIAFMRGAILLLMVITLVSACDVSDPGSTETATAIQSPIPTSTIPEIPATPTPTLIPLAAVVNGEELTLAEYEAELTRYQSALDDDGAQIEQDDEMRVLEDLINQILLAQGAVQMGYGVEEEAIQTRLSELISAAGGESQFNTWLQENEYTRESFRKALERSMLGAWMRDQILAEIPELAEQVHVRQIILYNADQANQVFAELESGREFATLIAIYEPVTQGDLGWFPRGFLPHTEIEEAAFNLQPGEYSQVIETSVGFHIIQVLERDQDRPLSPEARLVWKEKGLQEWMALQHEASDITILIPGQGE
jgi:peptidyl-prolyl cis-trans isomerase C